MTGMNLLSKAMCSFWSTMEDESTLGISRKSGRKEYGEGSSEYTVRQSGSGSEESVVAQKGFW